MTCRVVDVCTGSKLIKYVRLDALSPRRHKYIGPDWPSSALAGQHRWSSPASARQVRVSGDRQTNEQTDGCRHRVKPSLLQRGLNPLESRGIYGATSNNMKLVHWPLMGRLLHLVQRGGDWAGPQPAQAPPGCTKRNSPPINGQCTNSRIAV